MGAKVQIAAPVRNRAWILPAYLAALAALDHPREDLSFYFLANDCVDDSGRILRDWAAGRPGAVIEECTTGVRGWNRYRWPHYDYGNLAYLRNRILERFLEGDASHLFSVDSDVIVPPFALQDLLAADKDVIAGVISNFPGLSTDDSPAHNFLMRHDGAYRQERRVPREPFQVDVTGAVVLIRRGVVESGARYSARASGEDAGFCEQARAMGFALWCHGGVRCDHRMDDPAQSRPSAAPGGGLPPSPFPRATPLIKLPWWERS